jgi:hypothetical protein
MKKSIWLFSAGFLAALPFTSLSAQVNTTYEVVGASASPISASADYADQYELSEAHLDQMLAPIALYPDSVLTHILIAATYPLEVVEADRWRRNNPQLSAEEALWAVESQPWDASVKALVAFPPLLARMSEDLRWTQDLGDAFLISEATVMDRVQVLRNDAWQQGELASTQQITVIRQQRTIIIEPAVEHYVYLPHYDTRVIYGHWRWASYPPVYWQPFYPVSYARHTVYWGPAIRVSPSFYFGTLHWTNRHVVVLSAGYSPWPLYYSSISLSSHRSAVRWQHDSRHRRGVTYHPVYQSRYPQRTERRPEYRADPRPRYRADYRPDDRTGTRNNFQGTPDRHQRSYDTRSRVAAEPNQRNDFRQDRAERSPSDIASNSANAVRGQGPRQQAPRGSVARQQEPAARSSQEQSPPTQARPERSRPEQSRPVQARPQQSRPEQSGSAQATLEQSRSDQSRPQQSRPERSRPAQARPEQSRPEQSRPQQSRPEQALAAQVRQQQSRPEQSRPQQSRQEQSVVSQVRPEQSRPEQSRPQQPRPEQSRPAQAAPEQSRQEQRPREQSGQEQRSSREQQPRQERSREAEPRRNPEQSRPAQSRIAQEGRPERRRIQ